MSQVYDIIGVEIEPGDTVVYGVYSRGGGLAIGIVEEVIFDDVERQRYNPDYDRSKPRGDDNQYYIYETEQVPKIRFREPHTTYTDAFGDEQIKPGRRRTLDTPSRFAVIKKG